MQSPPLLHRDPLSFLRLFLALGVGVGAVTLVLTSAVNAPGLAMAGGGGLTLAFVAIVLHEVNLLLADEEPSA